MLNFYNFIDSSIKEINSFQKDCLINLKDPSIEEIEHICDLLNINKSVIIRMLDVEERSRIDIRDNYLLSVLNVAFKDDNDNIDVSPIGMLICNDYFLFVSNQFINPLTYFERINNKKDLIENKINVFIAIAYELSKSYINYTRNIIKEFEFLEEKLIISSENSDMLKVLNLQKTLTFFSMSLYSNDLVISRLMKLNDKEYKNILFNFSNIDDELLDDVYTENKQAIEMVDTYSKIVIDLMNTIASMVANEQNRFLKLLANITILLTIPVILAGFWGMNSKVPFEGEPAGFWIVVACSMILMALATLFLWKKKLLK